MGRYTYSSRTEADGLKKIELRWLKKQGYLNPDNWTSGRMIWKNKWSEKENSISITISTYECEPHLQLSYTQTDYENDSKKDFDYKIPLVTTSCNFGGKRYWFKCPMSRSGHFCGRRVGVLYKANDYFACRHCYDLTYASRKLSGIWKSAGTVISIPELEEIREKIKKRYYRGKLTKRYKAYLKKERKSLYQLMVVSKGLNYSI